MNILLINANPVVSRLISLCMRDNDIVYEEVKDVAEAEESEYDIVFVDDVSFSDKVTAFSSWVANIKKLVLLSSHDMDDEINSKFDLVIKKPFVPSRIREIIDQVRMEKEGKSVIDEIKPFVETEEREEIQSNVKREEPASEVNTKDEHFIFPLSSSKETEDKKETAAEEVSNPVPDKPNVSDGNEAEKENTLHGKNKEDKKETAAEEVSNPDPDKPNVSNDNELEWVKALLEKQKETAAEEVSNPIPDKPNVSDGNEAEKENTLHGKNKEDKKETAAEEVSNPDPDKPKVLDNNEVERIKTLLEESEEELFPEVDLEDEKEIETRKMTVITQRLKEEGVEIIDEGKIIDALSQQPVKPKKKKKKKKKRKEEAYTFEERLLAAVGQMKPKKIKKLLKGAEVTINIHFKDDV